MRKVQFRRKSLVLAGVVVLMLQGFSTLAQTKIDVNVYKPGTEIAVLKVNAEPAAGPVKVKLKNAVGRTLYTDISKEERYAKRISFANLSMGTYLLDLEQPNGVTRKVVVKNEEGLSVQDQQYYFQNSIRLSEADRKLIVRFSSNLDQKVTIRIADQQGNTVHEVSNISEATYATRFNLSGLRHGTYKVILISDAYTSAQSIRI